jgi:hypothetical protein
VTERLTILEEVNQFGSVFVTSGEHKTRLRSGEEMHRKRNHVRLCAFDDGVFAVEGMTTAETIGHRRGFIENDHDRVIIETLAKPFSTNRGSIREISPHLVA